MWNAPLPAHLPPWRLLGRGHLPAALCAASSRLRPPVVSCTMYWPAPWIIIILQLLTWAIIWGHFSHNYIHSHQPLLTVYYFYSLWSLFMCYHEAVHCMWVCLQGCVLLHFVYICFTSYLHILKPLMQYCSPIFFSFFSVAALTNFLPHCHSCAFCLFG